MLSHGWSTPTTVGVYSHLSMKDLDDKVLTLHGIKPKEEIMKSIVQVQKCENCGEDNAPYAIYCQNCSKPLTGKVDTDRILKELIERWPELTEKMKLIKKK